MRINAEKLTTFVEKATAKAKINMGTFVIANKELNVMVRSVDNIAAIVSKMKNINSDEEMVLPIKDTRFLINALNLFTGEIELKMEKNYLFIFNKDRQVEVPLAAKDYIENNLEHKPNLEYEKSATISSEVFKRAMKSRGLVNNEEIEIVTTPTTLTLVVGVKDAEKIRETINMPYIDSVSKFGDWLSDIVTVVGDKIEVSLKTEFPITIKENTADFEIMYIVAPRANEESE